MFGFTAERPVKGYEESIKELRKAIDECDAIVIGAGSGLSTAAGYRYSGDIFDKYFGDFGQRYGIRDIYAGGFYPFPDMETYWAWWSRHIWVNRYAPIPNDLYDRLLDLVQDKDYFVITTNVDHCFQRAGFDKERLFYTQGDYGLLQSSNPHGASAHKTYDNKEIVRKMLLAQGFEIGGNDELIIPEGTELAMRIPMEIIPYCPDDGELMTTNLRADDRFVEDEGWHRAAGRYNDFLQAGKERLLLLELGVGGNTPGIIKYPFWQLAAEDDSITYACINMGEAYAPKNIIGRSILIDGDIKDAIIKVACKAIFIDYTGTMVREDEPYTMELLKYFLTHSDLREPDTALAAVWGKIKEIEERYVGDDFIGKDEMVDKILEWCEKEHGLKGDHEYMHDIWRKSWIHAPLYDDVKPFLENCGLPVYVITNDDLCYIEESFRLKDIHPAGIVAAEMVRACKPHPEIFQKALEMAGVKPCEAVHIGDSIISDVEAAQAVGITPIYLSRKKDTAVEGVRVIRSLNELEDYM